MLLLQSLANLEFTNGKKNNRLWISSPLNKSYVKDLIKKNPELKYYVSLNFIRLTF